MPLAPGLLLMVTLLLASHQTPVKLSDTHGLAGPRNFVLVFLFHFFDLGGVSRIFSNSIGSLVPLSRDVQVLYVACMVLPMLILTLDVVPFIRDALSSTVHAHTVVVTSQNIRTHTHKRTHTQTHKHTHTLSHTHNACVPSRSHRPCFLGKSWTLASPGERQHGRILRCYCCSRSLC